MESDDEIFRRLQSMQQAEQEAKDVLEKFMSMASRREEDLSALMFKKLSDSKMLEAEVKLRNDENHALKERLLDIQNKFSLYEKQRNDDLGILQTELQQASSTIVILQHELKQQQTVYAGELTSTKQESHALSNKLKNITNENSQLIARMEHMKIEQTELQSSIASLHGEISSLQQELNETLTKENRIQKQNHELLFKIEQIDKENSKLKDEKMNLQQLIEQLQLQQQDVQQKNEIFINQNQTFSSKILELETSLNQSSSTNQEFNALLKTIQTENMKLQTEFTQSQQKLQSSYQQIKELGTVIDQLSREKEDLRRDQESQKGEHLGMLQDISALRDRYESLLSEFKKQKKRIERLEYEKQDLFQNLALKSQSQDGSKSVIQETEKRIQTLTDDLGQEKEVTARMKTELENKIHELEDCKEASKKLEDRHSKLEKEWVEERGRFERMQETAKQIQKENANRVVEFSQRNSKLSADLLTLQNELSQLRLQYEDVNMKLAKAEAERDELLGQCNYANTHIEDLECKIHDTTTKASHLADKTKELQEQFKKDTEVMREAFQKEMEKIRMSMDSEMRDQMNAFMIANETKIHELEASHAKVLTGVEQQLVSLQHLREQEVAEAKTIQSKLTKNIERLQRTLNEQLTRVTVLTEELDGYRNKAELNIGRSEPSSQIHRVDMDRNREKSRWESQVSDLQEQLRSAVESKMMLEQKVLALETQLKQEKDRKASLQQKNSELEEELTSLQTSSESHTDTLNNLKLHEKQLQNSITSKDSEIQRLKKRNEVLTESIARLTQAQEQGQLHVSSSSTPIINKESLAVTIGDFFQNIPQGDYKDHAANTYSNSPYIIPKSIYGENNIGNSYFNRDPASAPPITRTDSQYRANESRESLNDGLRSRSANNVSEVKYRSEYLETTNPDLLSSRDRERFETRTTNDIWDENGNPNQTSYRSQNQSYLPTNSYISANPSQSIYSIQDSIRYDSNYGQNPIVSPNAFPRNSEGMHDDGTDPAVVQDTLQRVQAALERRKQPRPGSSSGLQIHSQPLTDVSSRKLMGAAKNMMPPSQTGSSFGTENSKPVSPIVLNVQGSPVATTNSLQDLSQEQRGHEDSFTVDSFVEDSISAQVLKKPESKTLKTIRRLYAELEDASPLDTGGANNSGSMAYGIEGHDGSLSSTTGSFPQRIREVVGQGKETSDPSIFLGHSNGPSFTDSDKSPYALQVSKCSPQIPPVIQNMGFGGGRQQGSSSSNGQVSAERVNQVYGSTTNGRSRNSTGGSQESTRAKPKRSR